MYEATRGTQWLIAFPDSSLGAALGTLHAALVEIIRAEERLEWNGKIEVAEEHVEALRFCSIQLTKVWLSQIETNLSEGTAEDRTTPWIFVQHAEGFWKNHAGLYAARSLGTKTQRQEESVEAYAKAVEQAKVALKRFLRIWINDDQGDNDSEFGGQSSVSQSFSNPPTSQAATNETQD
jgi:hypothetical protein